jgi:predicted nucleic acid-binding protein
MNKTLLDTNIVLDALAAREPFREEAEKIFLLAANGVFEACVTASSLTDIYYIARKTLSEAKARAALRRLLCLFVVLPVTGEDCEEALQLPIADYEDALLQVCASHAGVDGIVTRDSAFLDTSTPVATFLPKEFLQRWAE